MILPRYTTTYTCRTCGYVRGDMPSGGHCTQCGSNASYEKNVIFRDPGEGYRMYSKEVNSCTACGRNGNKRDRFCEDCGGTMEKKKVEVREAPKGFVQPPTQGYEDYDEYPYHDEYPYD